MLKLNIKKFALAGGLYGALLFAVATASGIIGIPGFPPFVNLLMSFYGPYGYTMTWTGVVIGAVCGFIEGFIHLGVFAWIYNRLLGNNAQ
jgi:hypothetical protein